jgi:hypothetical protein
LRRALVNLRRVIRDALAALDSALDAGVATTSANGGAH